MGSAGLAIPGRFPNGKANFVVVTNTHSYKGILVKRIPFKVDNPSFDKPLAPLSQTKELRKQNPQDTVLELFNGADLASFGVPSYDGVRDRFIADTGGHGGYTNGAGGCGGGGKCVGTCRAC